MREGTIAKRPDYYRILQVHPIAEKEVIDAAYRRLAAKYHPDVNLASDATERLKQLNIAYEVLSNPVKRIEYDTFRDPSSSKSSRKFLKVAVIILILFAAFRWAPSLLPLFIRIVVPLAIVLLIIWSLFKLTRPNR